MNDHDLSVPGADTLDAPEPEDGVHVVRVADPDAEVGTEPAPVTRETILEL